MTENEKKLMEQMYEMTKEMMEMMEEMDSRFDKLDNRMERLETKLGDLNNVNTGILATFQRGFADVNEGLSEIKQINKNRKTAKEIVEGIAGNGK